MKVQKQLSQISVSPSTQGIGLEPAEDIDRWQGFIITMCYYDSLP